MKYIKTEGENMKKEEIKRILDEHFSFWDYDCTKYDCFARDMMGFDTYYVGYSHPSEKWGKAIADVLPLIFNRQVEDYAEETSPENRDNLILALNWLRKIGWVGWNYVLNPWFEFGSDVKVELNANISVDDVFYKTIKVPFDENFITALIEWLKEERKYEQH